MASQNNNNDSTVLHRIDGRGVMLKVKQALPIGKMCFSFVQYGSDNKMTSSVDCYLSAEDFGLLMARIRTGALQRQIANEKLRAKQAGEQYPKFVWQSPLGGGETANGIVSRHFNIAPGARDTVEVLFTGIVMPATKSPTGAFIPTRGARGTSIRVPATYHDLELMAYKWQWLERDYMSKRYSMEALKDTYHSQQNAQYQQPTPQQNSFQQAPVQQNSYQQPFPGV